MATRADKMLASLDARYRYKANIERIDRDIADEQQRFQAMQSYAEQARTELNALDAEMSAVKDQGGLASELIKMVDRDNIALARSIAQGKGQARAERSVPTGVAAAIDAAKKSSSKTSAAVTKSITALSGDLTSEQAEAVVSALGTLSLSAGEQKRVQAALGSKKRRGAVSGAPRVTPEQAQQIELTRRASEIIEFGSPAGIAGGFDGEAEVDRRRASRLEGSLFATEDDAYKVYLSLLDDGRVTVDEITARFPSATPEQAQAALSEGHRVYSEAKLAKAYRNDERKFFSERYLDQARKVAEMEARVEELTPQYTNAANERLRRQLVARGIDPDDPYVAYRGTPMYDYVKSADRIMGEVQGEELRAATKEQVAVSRLLDQYAASDMEWTADDLAAQLGKTLKGTALVDAIGFGLALDKQRTEGLDAPTQLQLQTEKSRKDAEFKRKQAQFLNREMQLLDQMQKEKDRLSKEAVLEDVRQDEQEKIAREARAAYTRARAAGATPEDARAVMQEVYASAPRAAVVEKTLEPFGGSKTLMGVAEEVQAAAPGSEAEARIGIGAERGLMQEGAFDAEAKLLGEPTADFDLGGGVTVDPPAPAPAPRRVARPAPAPEPAFMPELDQVSEPGDPVAAPAPAPAPAPVDPFARQPGESDDAYRTRLLGG